MRNIFGHGSFSARAPFMGGPAEVPEEAIRTVESLQSSIEMERSADASDFAALVTAGKRRLDMVFEVKRAEDKLAEETKKWESAHMNADALQNAQQALDAVQAQYSQTVAEIQRLRDAVNAHADRIGSLWDRIERTIAALPEGQQGIARETCRVNRSMNGSGTCEHGESSLGCKKCQRGRKRKQYQNQKPPGLLQQMNGGFLGEVSLAGMGQTTTMSPTSTPPPAPKAPAAPAAAPASSGWTPAQIGVGVGILALAVGLVVFSRSKR
jgi:hypothetical protein